MVVVSMVVDLVLPTSERFVLPFSLIDTNYLPTECSRRSGATGR